MNQPHSPRVMSPNNSIHTLGMHSPHPSMTMYPPAGLDTWNRYCSPPPGSAVYNFHPEQFSLPRVQSPNPFLFHMPQSPSPPGPQDEPVDYTKKKTCIPEGMEIDVPQDLSNKNRNILQDKKPQFFLSELQSKQVQEQAESILLQQQKREQQIFQQQQERLRQLGIVPERKLVNGMLPDWGGWDYRDRANKRQTLSIDPNYDTLPENLSSTYRSNPTESVVHKEDPLDVTEGILRTQYRQASLGSPYESMQCQSSDPSLSSDSEIGFNDDMLSQTDISFAAAQGLKRLHFSPCDEEKSAKSKTDPRSKDGTRPISGEFTKSGRPLSIAVEHVIIDEQVAHKPVASPTKNISQTFPDTKHALNIDEPVQRFIQDLPPKLQKQIQEAQQKKLEHKKQIEMSKYSKSHKKQQQPVKQRKEIMMDVDKHSDFQRDLQKQLPVSRTPQVRQSVIKTGPLYNSLPENAETKLKYQVLEASRPTEEGTTVKSLPLTGSQDDEFSSVKEFRCCNTWPGTRLPRTQKQRRTQEKKDTSKEEAKDADAIKTVSVSLDKNLIIHPYSMQPPASVLITYALGDEKHMKEIVVLYNCLIKNDFQPYLDVKDRAEFAKDIHGWVNRKFNAAKFVLVCVSPLYKKTVESDVATSAPYFSHPSTRACKFLYTLMQNEFSNNNCKNTRFIPLLFPGATVKDTPTWLQSTIPYRWRDHWKDVMFRLLEPKRIMRSIKINEEKFKPLIKSRQT